MADDARSQLTRFIATGSQAKSGAITNMSSAIDPAHKRTLRDKIKKLQDEHDIVHPDSQPGDFRNALQTREKKVASKHGKDIPRPYSQNHYVQHVYKAHDAIVALPHPGGLGMLILLIVLFFLILIPATSSGETRTLLLWDVLLGRKHVHQSDTSRASPPREPTPTVDPVRPRPPIPREPSSDLHQFTGSMGNVPDGLGFQ